MNKIHNRINKEIGIHGSQWHIMHGGYFSDPSIAAPFIDVLLKAIDISRPGIVVDIAGGTGFLLRELIKRRIDPGIPLVNLDISQKQLDMSQHDRIVPLNKTIDAFRREDTKMQDKRFLFMMRSALHYYGKDSLMPVLRHLRSQMKRGEFFVHQTACFKNDEDARCLNGLYDYTGTDKWYPTAEDLCRYLKETGWSIKSIVPAPALPLTSQDLGKRYGLGKRRLSEIRDELVKCFGEKKDIFMLTRDGFCAYLHYRIFICVAI
jgi:SAM-dependent methyltransferase